jgi:hypothetical protein
MTRKKTERSDSVNRFESVEAQTLAPIMKKDDFSDSEEELVRTSSSQVLAEYDRGYKKLGEPFARGDCMSNLIALLLTSSNMVQW